MGVLLVFDQVLGNQGRSLRVTGRDQKKQDDTNKWSNKTHHVRKEYYSQGMKIPSIWNMILPCDIVFPSSPPKVERAVPGACLMVFEFLSISVLGSLRFPNAYDFWMQ